jgi:arginyl-tRNA synthetase
LEPEERSDRAGMRILCAAMLNVRRDLDAAVAAALAEMGVDSAVAAAMERSGRPEFGDWSTPAALKSARVLRTSPMAIAQTLCDKLNQQSLACVAEWTITPPGYVNARLADTVWVAGVLEDALALDRSIPLLDGPLIDQGRTLIEHTATNPNKAAHVGHLRNACIGDTMARMLRRTGQDVEVQNYIDDTGVQVADVAIGVRELGIAQRADEAFDQYCSRVYVEVGKRYEEQPELLDKRREVLHAIEAGDNETATYVKELASKVVECHLQTMGRFDIDYELLAWESDILHLGFWQQAFELLKTKGAIVKHETGKLAGCWVMPGETDDADEGKVFVKSDGVATYTAKDTAYQLWKFGLLGRDFRYLPWRGSSDLFTTSSHDGDDGDGRFGRADRVINVIDARQAYPQGVVKASLERLGFTKQAANSVHLGYEVVALSLDAARELGLDVEAGKDVYAFSGRRGIEVRADELLDRAIDRISDKASQEGVVAAVASGAIRYYLLKFSLNQIIAFDFDEVLRTTGDTGVYLQYAHARTAGILRRVADEGNDGDIPALEPSERALVHQLDAYKYELNSAAREMAPHLLCTYAFELAAALSDFYEHTPPIVHEKDEAIRGFRRRLVAATRATLADTLETLGLHAPERI